MALRANRLQKQVLIVVSIFLFLSGARTVGTEEQKEENRFTKEELTQMVAPIALYPDALIAQILMASTYPIEVVEAERWLRQNTSLKGEELDKALQLMPWDPSVKSLCNYPDVLFSMSEKLDQTTRLGDAFLSQQNEIMATIQDLRRKASDQGNLATTKEQRVIADQDFIRIEPVDPRVVYVPAYDPLYVYGPWWYPSYPPYYWYYPPGFLLGGPYIGFGYGYYVGFGIASWCWFDWHHHHIQTDYYKTKDFHRHDHARKSGDIPYWRHDPSHRKGATYRDRKTSERYALKPSRAASSKYEKPAAVPKGSEKKVSPDRTAAGTRTTGVPPSVRERPATAPQGGERRVPAERPSGSEARTSSAPPAVRHDQIRVENPAAPKSPGSGIEKRSIDRGPTEQAPIISPSAEPPRPSMDTGRLGIMGPDGGGFQGGGPQGGAGRPPAPSRGGGFGK